MFNLIKKKQVDLIAHRYKNLLISLPANWQYEFEDGGQEACFDPKSQSTLRLNILQVTSPQGMTSEEIIQSLTDNQAYSTTPKGFLLTGPAYSNHIDNNNSITLITWKLINYSGSEKIIAVFTYTVLSEEKDSAQENTIFKLIESSLQEAELS